MIVPAAYRQVLANRRFRLFALGFGVSSIGDGMSALAVAWLAIEISTPATRGFVVGGAVAAYTLPACLGILLRRVVGHVESRRLLLLNCCLRAACLSAIALLAGIARLQVLSYIALLAASALLASWGTAARYVLVAETLPATMRLGGNALVGALLNAGVIAGPAAAGFITAATGPGAVLAIDALSWMVYAACVLLAGAARTPDGSLNHVDAAAGSALRLIAGNRALLGLLILTLAFYFFYGPVEVALPIFVSQTLHASAAVLGAYWTCFGVGAVTGGLVFGVMRRAPLFSVALLIVVGWGAALAIVPLVGVVAGIAAFTVAGLTWAPYPTLVTTFLQQQVRGRALSTLSATWTSSTMLATPLGTAAGGPLVAGFGPGVTLLVSALATLAIVPVALVVRQRS